MRDTKRPERTSSAESETIGACAEVFSGRTTGAFEEILSEDRAAGTCKEVCSDSGTTEKRTEMLPEDERHPAAQNTFERIYEIVRQIPYGRVATYGQVAALAGNKRLSRVVGYALHVNPDPENIPCFRVVNRFGEVSRAFAFGGGNRQVELLEAEGVKFVDGRVDLKHYQWEKRRF